MLLFAHLGLTLAAADLLRRPAGIRPALALLALGSMLPDIIDKPLGYAIFGTPAMGRIYAHTLLFLLALAALAMIRISAASLAGGVLAHLALDMIWLSPTVFLWPLLGEFPSANPIGILSYMDMIIRGLGDPGIFVPEMAGLAYLVYFGIRSNILAHVKTLLGEASFRLASM
jgi:hypothetical protein